MKKFVFVLTVVLVCMMLVSCGSGQMKRKRNVHGNYAWSEKAEEKMNWDEAKEYCEDLDQDAYNDWRLPSSEEMRTIYSESNHSNVFGENDTFWTSEEINDNRARTFEFSFARKDAVNKSTRFAVRCLRTNE
ncbi:DUF1566 domain-containing protein [bacterium]|nr:DUF1566 domain-containing protein [bacterium]